MDISKYVVRTNGFINRLSTIQNFSKELEKFALDKKAENEAFSEAINTVFDNNSGNHINKPILINLALQELNAQPTNFYSLSNRLAKFIDYNVGEKGKKIFGIGKGKNGGVWRW